MKAARSGQKSSWGTVRYGMVRYCIVRPARLAAPSRATPCQRSSGLAALRYADCPGTGLRSPGVPQAWRPSGTPSDFVVASLYTVKAPKGPGHMGYGPHVWLRQAVLHRVSVPQAWRPSGTLTKKKSPGNGCAPGTGLRSPGVPQAWRPSGTPSDFVVASLYTVKAPKGPGVHLGL
jgi:hypothetical protein